MVGGANLVIPSIILVVDNSSSKTSSRVNSSASDWDCGQVNHEDSKPNWEWGQNLENSEIKTIFHYQEPNRIIKIIIHIVGPLNFFSEINKIGQNISRKIC